MALTDTYASPLDFETPEEKRKRERNKFRIMSTPILDAFQKKAAQGQAQVESFKFRQNASQFQQSNQEVQKFRQKVLDSGLLHQRFTPGAPSASGASQAAKEAADQEITRMGGEYWKRPENSQRYDELTSIIEGKAPARHGEPPLPGVVGKIPGFRTPAEAAATIGTVGIGTTGTLGRRALQAGAQTLLGSGGAAVGGPAAEKVGAPAWTGELALGLGGAAGGRAWADNAATAFSREAPNAPTLARRLATEETEETQLSGFNRNIEQRLTSTGAFDMGDIKGMASPEGLGRPVGNPVLESARKRIDNEISRAKGVFEARKARGVPGYNREVAWEELFHAYEEEYNRLGALLQQVENRNSAEALALREARKGIIDDANAFLERNGADLTFEGGVLSKADEIPIRRLAETQTGQPFVAKLYRGESGDLNRTAEIKATSGLFMTPDVETAVRYAETGKSGTVGSRVNFGNEAFSNPIVFEDEVDGAAKLLSGKVQPDPYGSIDAQMAQEARKLGHDAIVYTKGEGGAGSVVDLRPSPTGRGTSKLGLARRLATEETGGTKLPKAPQPEEAVKSDLLDFDVKMFNQLDTPPGEKIQREVTRRLAGGIREPGERLRIVGQDIRRAAGKAGVRLSPSRTPETERLILAMEDDVSLGALSPGEQSLVARLQAVLKAEEKAMLAADPSFESRLLDQYFPHLFKKEVAGKRAGPRAFFMKGRTQEGGIMEILQRRPDLDLRSWNPVDLVEMRVASGIKYRAGLRVRERLEAAGQAMPVSQAPDDWVVPDSPIFKGSKFKVQRSTQGQMAEDVASKMEAKAERLTEKAGNLRERIAESPEDIVLPGRTVQEDLATPPEIADYFNDVFGMSAFRKSAPLRIAATVSQVFKQVKTMGGLFQINDYTMRQLGVGAGETLRGRVKMAPRSVGVSLRAVARGFVPAVDRKLARWDVTDPIRSALIRNGLQLDGGLDIMERSLRELFEEPGIFKGVTGSGPVRAAKGALRYMNDASFLKTHREHALSLGEMRVKQFVKQGDPLDKAAAKAALMTNEQLSSIPAWQSVFRNPTTRDTMRAGFFSPNESEAWWRNFLRPVIGPNRAASIGFYGGIMANVVAWANFINFVSTGKPLPLEAYQPWREGGEFGLPIGYNTRFMRPELPWKGPLGQALYLDLLGQADTPFRWALSPVFGTKSRLSVPAGTALQASGLLTGGGIKDFGNRPVEGRGDILRWGAASTVPIVAQSFIEEKSRIGGAGAGLQATGLNVSSESTRDLLARRFKEVTGKDFNPEIHYPVAEQMPELKPILEAQSEAAVKAGSETAIARQEREALLGEVQADLNLIETARSIKEGNEAAMPQFAKAYGDFQQSAADFVKRDFFGADERKMKTPEGKLFQAYYDVQPANQDYIDPETFTTDWGRYFADKEAAFAKLPLDLQGALEARSKLPDADAREIETRFKQAKKDVRAYYEIPKYKGLSLDEGEKVDDMRRAMTYVRTVSGKPDKYDNRWAFRQVSKMFDAKIVAFVKKNFLPRPDYSRSALGGGLGGGLGGSFGKNYRGPKREPLSAERDLFAQARPDLFYFGLVSPSTLTMEQQSQLAPEFLGRNVEAPVGAY